MPQEMTPASVQAPCLRRQSRGPPESPCNEQVTVHDPQPAKARAHAERAPPGSPGSPRCRAGKPATQERVTHRRETLFYQGRERQPRSLTGPHVLRNFFLFPPQEKMTLGLSRFLSFLSSKAILFTFLLRIVATLINLPSVLKLESPKHYCTGLH